MPTDLTKRERKWRLPRWARRREMFGPKDRTKRDKEDSGKFRVRRKRANKISAESRREQRLRAKGKRYCCKVL